MQWQHGFLHCNEILEIAEELGTDEQAETDARVVLVVIEHRLTIAVVVLQHDKLVGIVINAIAQLNDGIEIKVPSFTLNQRHVENPLVVITHGLETCLRDTTVTQNVLIVLAVDNGNPVLGMCHEIGRDVGLAGNRDFIPAA